MTAEEAIRYIRNQKWNTMRLGLDRIRELLALLGHPERELQFIHVAGTNGKGSACAMLASVFRAAGYRTGLFTSPDLLRFQERMQVDGRQIPDGQLAELTETAAECAERMEDHPSEYELSTAIAFLWFLKERCDIVILETGLGGLLDSTNVIEHPEAVLSMNIGLEHTEYLGRTIPEIALQKAGIIKPGTAAVCYDSGPESREVFQRVCRERGAEFVPVDFSDIRLLKREYPGQRILWREQEEYSLALQGDIQVRNAAAVLTLIEVMRGRGWDLPLQAVEEGFLQVRWPARFEVLSANPAIVIDGAHNPQCMEELAASLRSCFPGRRFVFIIGVLADKDYHTMLRSLYPIAEKMVCVTPDSPRALPAEELAETAREGTEAEAAYGWREALLLAGTGVKDVAVCGSLYMVGHIREIILAEDNTFIHRKVSDLHTPEGNTEA